MLVKFFTSPHRTSKRGVLLGSMWYKKKKNQQKRALRLPPWAEQRECNRVREQKENIIRNADKFKFDVMTKEEI